MHLEPSPRPDPPPQRHGENSVATHATHVRAQPVTREDPNPMSNSSAATRVRRQFGILAIFQALKNTNPAQPKTDQLQRRQTRDCSTVQSDQESAATDAGGLIRRPTNVVALGVEKL